MIKDHGRISPSRDTLQAKTRANALPQSGFLLHSDERRYASSGRIEEDQRRVTDLMTGGKRLAFDAIQVGQHKGHVSLKLRSERVHDALELRAVRSTGEKHLHDGGLFADNLESAVGRLPR